MKNKNKGILVAILIFLIVLLLGGIGYIAYDQGLIFNNNNNVAEDNNKNETEIENEVEIDSIEEKNKLKNFIDKINSNSLYGFGNIKIYDDLQLNESEKLELALKYLEFDAITIPANQISINDTNEIELIVSTGMGGQISLDKVVNEYYKLFNETITNYIDITNGCPRYYYDSVNKMYYNISGCGGTVGPDSPITYINKYSTKGDEVYIYMSAGYTRYSSSNTSTTYVNVYTDMEGTKWYATEPYDSEHINQTNYTDFGEYKYTFGKRDDGTYYFKSIEKTR